MSTPYRRAKFIVEGNARKQAIGDATSQPADRIEEALDPLAPIEMIPNLLQFVRTPKGQMIFRGTSQPDYLALTENEKIELQNYWVERYLAIVKEELTKRSKGE
jgi:hypothetical protein